MTIPNVRTLDPGTCGNPGTEMLSREPPVLYPAVEREERSLWVWGPSDAIFGPPWMSIVFLLFIFGFDGSRFHAGYLKKSAPVGHLFATFLSLFLRLNQRWRPGQR